LRAGVALDRLYGAAAARAVAAGRDGGRGRNRALLEVARQRLTQTMIGRDEGRRRWRTVVISGGGTGDRAGDSWKRSPATATGC